MSGLEMSECVSAPPEAQRTHITFENKIAKMSNAHVIQSFGASGIGVIADMTYEHTVQSSRIHKWAQNLVRQ
jgi:hypothetical protein